MMTFGRFRSENVSSAKFPFCKLFPIYRKHHRVSNQAQRGERLPFLGSKSRLPGSCRGERHTSKRKSKCFYFKIHHLQLSSKFVSPIYRLHFSRHILVIDLNLYFLHALPLFFSLSPSLPLFSWAMTGASLASFPAHKILSTSTQTATGNRELINSKSFLVFL